MTLTAAFHPFGDVHARHDDEHASGELALAADGAAGAEMATDGVAG